MNKTKKHKMNKVITFFKRLTVMILTVAVLMLGFLSAAVFLMSPITYWWLWIPNAILCMYIFQPITAKWEKTFNGWFGLNDMFNTKHKS